MQATKQRIAIVARTAVVAGLLVTTSASADFVVNATEVGSDVVMTGSGTLDLSTWTNLGAIGGDLTASVDPSRIFLGEDAFNVDIWANPASFTGPSSITTVTRIGFGVGDAMGFLFSGGIYLQGGFTSGDQLDNISTYSGESFASMGLIDGEQYVWTWDTATGDVESFIINIGIVPAPGAFALLGLAGLVTPRRRR